MPIPAIRTKQTTSTAGTGTLTLNAASAEFRSFNAAFGGASIEVLYALSRAGVYEVGYGTFNGGSPGTLTRNTVIASSNAGALVSLAAGTTDVFVDFLPGTRAARLLTTSATLVLADIGNLVRYTGSADGVITLPAASTVPPNTGFLIANQGTNFAVVTIDPNGAELIEGSATPFPLFTNEAIEIFSTGTAWRAGVRPTGWRLVSRASASTSTSVDFALPLWPTAARTACRFEFRHVRLTDGSFLGLRVDDAGGASFDAGATDYRWSGGYVSGAAAWAAQASTGDTLIRLSTDVDLTETGNTLNGTVDFYPGSTVARFPLARFTTFANGNGGIYAGPQPWIGGGQRLAAIDANAVRFIPNTGTINLGEFVQYVMHD